MVNLIAKFETFTSGYNEIFLDIFSLGAILFGISVIISKNPIISVLFLIGLFTNIASYLITSGFNFIGLSYLLVYIGAISILFLFILMLINVRVSELTSYTSNSIPLAIIGGTPFIYSVYKILPYSEAGYENIYNNINSIYNIGYNIILFILDIITKSIYIKYVTSKQWDNNLVGISDITAIGNILYTNYSLWLIITSIILLLSMVGTITLVRDNRQDLSYYQVSKAMFTVTTVLQSSKKPNFKLNDIK